MTPSAQHKNFVLIFLVNYCNLTVFLKVSVGRRVNPMSVPRCVSFIVLLAGWQTAAAQRQRFQTYLRSFTKIATTDTLYPACNIATAYHSGNMFYVPRPPDTFSQLLITTHN